MPKCQQPSSLGGEGLVSQSLLMDPASSWTFHTGISLLLGRLEAKSPLLYVSFGCLEVTKLRLGKKCVVDFS